MPKQDQRAKAATHIDVEHLDVDDSEFSDLGDSIADTDYTSISSSIREHVYENGRRYHSLNAGKYVMPNDDNEQERLDMNHHLTGLLLGGALHLAELPDKLSRVLDLGTGTGIWAIDMADMHPEATVIGVDLSPIQPRWVPPNCTFDVDDLDKPWLWTQPFDFIHSANISQGISDFPAYAKRIYDNLAPNGIVELLEAELGIRTDDDSLPKEGHIETYLKHFWEAAKVVGLRDVTKDLEKCLLDAGFVDVKVVVKKLPIGPWPKNPKQKELGRWGLAIISGGFKSYGLALFTRVLGMSQEEATKLCESAFAEFKGSIHTYNAQWYVEGRKPAVGEVC